MAGRLDRRRWRVSSQPSWIIWFCFSYWKLECGQHTANWSTWLLLGICLSSQLLLCTVGVFLRVLVPSLPNMKTTALSLLSENTHSVYIKIALITFKYYLKILDIFTFQYTLLFSQYISISIIIFLSLFNFLAQTYKTIYFGTESIILHFFVKVV